MAITLLGKMVLWELGTWAAPRALGQVKKRQGSPGRYHGGSIVIDPKNLGRALNEARRVTARTPQVRGMLVQAEQAAHRRVRHLEEELSAQPDAQARARLWACMLGYCALGSASAFLSSILEDGIDEPHAYAMA